jgi:hypothetical protein
MWQIGRTQPPGTVSAKLKAQKEAEQNMPEEDYESRIKKSELYGVYIPKDLGDVFAQLNKLTDEPSRYKFKSMTEEDARYKLHFSLGRWMTSNWGFFGGSRLTKYLNDIGLYEPDDMVRFLIVTYHRELNGKPLGVKELIAEFQEMRGREKEQRLQEGTIIHQETRKRKPNEN